MSKIKKALEKAKVARESDGDSSVQKSEISPSASSPQTEMRHDGEVQVTYTKTKVINIERQLLKNNKVISLFHEDRMTDRLKILRTQILNRLKEIGGNSLLVTSAVPGEGKTFTAINLGISIAQELNRTVLLVDADLRPPTEHHRNFSSDFLGVNIGHGLSDYLLRQAEIPDLLFNPGIEKLSILPAGKPVPNSAELLGSERMESLVEELKSRYRGDRIAIFDSPSLLTCPDPMVLSRFVSGILLVVESEKTSADDIKRAMELLKDKPVLGTLLNKAR
jgi:protein-tyrosine kinase